MQINTTLPVQGGNDKPADVGLVVYDGNSDRYSVAG
jgi:hypothetical protein